MVSSFSGMIATGESGVMRDTAPASDWFPMMSREGIRVIVYPVRSSRFARYLLSILRTICRLPAAGPSKLSLRTGWDATMKMPSGLLTIPQVPVGDVLSMAEFSSRRVLDREAGTGSVIDELKL